MKVTIKQTVEKEVKTLLVRAGVRYWEDATVNGVEDEEGKLIPCRTGDNWCPEIDIENGIITNWIKGIEANIHYKICDDGTYTLCDENNTAVLIKDGYVPDIMCPEGEGYGDYIIMHVDENGKISNWKTDIEDFNEEED